MISLCGTWLDNALSDSQRSCSSSDVFQSCLDTDPSRGQKLDIRERALECPDVLWASCPAGFRIKHRARSYQNPVTITLRHTFHDAQGVWDGHGKFHRGDPAADYALHCPEGFFGRLHPDNRHDPNLAKERERFFPSP